MKPVFFLTMLPSLALLALGTAESDGNDGILPKLEQHPTTSITLSPLPARLALQPTSDSDACSYLVQGLGQDDAGQPGKYQAFCNVDYPGNDVYPFLLVGSAKECLSKCDSYLDSNGKSACVGFIYAPDRRYHGADDCYLKSMVNNPQSASVKLVGAMLRTSTSAPPSSSSTESTALAVAAQTDPIKQGASSKNITVEEVKILGASTNKPTTQYLKHPPYPEIKMASSLMKPGINLDLITKYPIAKDTGVWTSKSNPFKDTFGEIKGTPRLSRDGGKGANVNGTNIFVFCDTGIYTNDEWVGFVSSSVATDEDMNGLKDEPLTLVDHIGQWQDDIGRMRGFAPMTEGEEAFNKQISGDGFRYAIWPEATPTELNSTHAVLWATVVYDEVNMATQNATFQDYTLTALGNTILTTGIDSHYGPQAVREAPLFFTQKQQIDILYGSVGAFRAWGPSGWGGLDGYIYLFGKVPNYSRPGIFMAKVEARNYLDSTKYQYYWGPEWSIEPPGADNHNAALIRDKIQDLDIIYSEGTNTFVMVYMKPGQNKFFFRLTIPPVEIVPAWKGGPYDWADIAMKGRWTDERVLFEIPPPKFGVVYAGGLHAGYFGDEDLTKNGTKALLTWTERTGLDGNDPATGYTLGSAVIRFNGHHYED